MQAALRPMNLGEILDRTFEIYRKRFLLFAGIAVLPAAAMLALHLADLTWLHSERWFGAQNDPGARMAVGWLVAYLYYHISGLAWLLVQPAFVSAASREIFAESNSIGNSLRLLAARWLTYLWVAFLRHCAQLVIPEGLAFGLIVAIAFLDEKLRLFKSSSTAGFIALFAVACLFAAFLWVGSSFAFAMPAAALEQMSGWKSLGRSWRLAKKSRWRILVAWIMAVVCVSALEGVGAFLSWAIATLLTPGHLSGSFNQQLYEVLVYFFYALTAVVVGPLYPIAITLLYYDQRSRKEGYDLERMMEAAGLLAPVAAEVAFPAKVSVIGAADANELHPTNPSIENARGF